MIHSAQSSNPSQEKTNTSNAESSPSGQEQWCIPCIRQLRNNVNHRCEKGPYKHGRCLSCAATPISNKNARSKPCSKDVAPLRYQYAVRRAACDIENKVVESEDQLSDALSEWEGRCIQQLTRKNVR